MMRWSIAALTAVILCAAIAVGEQPLASFHGTLVSADSKKVSIRVEDENVMDFNVSKKTRFFVGKKQSDVKSLKPGDTVTVEGVPAIDGSVDAIHVRVEPAKPQN